MDSFKYSLLLVTPIPVHRVGGRVYTLDLWVRDLAAQLSIVDRLCVLAPERQESVSNDLALPEAIRVLTPGDLTGGDDLDRLVREFDVVQVGSGMPRRAAEWMFRSARAAIEADRCLVLGVSSNRAKTTIMNAQNAGWLKRLKARFTSRQILGVQTRLAEMADGVYLVGHGLALVSPHPNTHVGTASWITKNDVISEAALRQRFADRPAALPLRLCVAARLEYMKGTHLAVEAVKLLRDRLGARSPRLTILGEGPERGALEQLVARLGVGDRVTFGGTFEYPGPFHRELTNHDLLLLTNLNREQPRVVFDAASQGVLPLCPDSEPYRALDVDARLLYRSGDAEALADVIQRFQEPAHLEALLFTLAGFAQRHTIESMHEERAAWIRKTLDRKNVGAGSAVLGSLAEAGRSAR